MNVNKKLAQDWIESTSLILPGFDAILAEASTPVLLIGAAVFDFYAYQGWLPALSRRTGDIDLSISLVHGTDDYQKLAAKLLSLGYRQGPPAYRFFPPAIPGAIAYVDLLAHPMAESVSEMSARTLMGVGPNFSFAGMSFALESAFETHSNLFCPHPIGFLRLKIASYEDEPAKRLKDLADIVELARGIVQAGHHFEMAEYWSVWKSHKDAIYVKRVLGEIGADRSQAWDMSRAEHELALRGFDFEAQEAELLQNLVDWAEALEN